MARGKFGTGRRWVRSGMAVLAVVGIAAPVVAQQVDVPGFRPGREPELLQPSQPQPKATLDLYVPEGGGGAAVPEAEGIQMHLTSLAIDGATVYPQAELAALYQPLLDKGDVTLADIYRLAEAITVKYRDDGYVLSRALVPAQKISGGAVRLTVVEGFVDRVSIEGDKLAEDAAIRPTLNDYLDKIKASRPARIQDIERYLLLINDLAGIRARSVIRPSPSGDLGASELVLVTEETPVDAQAILDNYGSKYVGPWELFAESNLNSPFGLGEKVTVRALTTQPISELKFTQGALSLPLGSEGLTLAGNVSYSDSHPGFLLAPLDVIARSLTAEGTLSYPLIRSRAQNLTVAGGYHYGRIATDVLNAPFSRENARSVFANATYDFADSWDGSNLLGLTVTQGLDWMNATGKNALYSARADAGANYTKFSGDILRNQQLDTNLTLVLSGQWQYSAVPLPSSQEFALGGKALGRGYDAGEISADSGIGGKIELRYGETVDTPSITSYAVYAFYDVGQVWSADPADRGTVNASHSIASTGLGAQAGLGDWANLKLEAAKPLTAVPAVQRQDKPAAWKDPRLFMTLSAHF